MGLELTTTTATSSSGVSSVGWDENHNFLQLPDHVIGVNQVFKMDNSTISSGLFNLKYQLFLNDLYYYGALDLLNYTMTKTYLEDLSRLILQMFKLGYKNNIDFIWILIGRNLLKINILFLIVIGQ